MGRNNLILIEFSNPTSGAEVTIPPMVVAQIGGALEALANIIVGMGGERGRSTVRLAAVDRGSLILGFLLISPSSDVMNESELSDRTRKIIRGAGLLLGSFAVGYVGYSAPKMMEEPQTRAQIEQCAVNAKFHQQLNELVKAAKSAGCEKVTIALDDLNPLTVEASPFHPGAIGSMATQKDFSGQEYRGLLNNVEGPFIFNPDEPSPLNLYTGDIVVDGERVRVLVHWRSKRPAPIGGSVTVVGSLEPLVPNGFSIKPPMDHRLKLVQAELVVAKQIVEE